MPRLIDAPQDDAIGLDELVERAALQTRIDRKYVVPVTAIGALIESVPHDTRALEIAGRRSFGYRSVYFDSPDLVSFHTAGRGRRLRFKVRTRAYLDTGTSWLEVKTRAGRGATIKQRMVHADAFSVDASFVDATLADARIDTAAAHLEPVLVTRYRRSTLFLPGPDSRVTIDVDLSWTSLRNARAVNRPQLAVVETKTGSTPSAVDRLLWAAGHRPVRLSKYGVGLAALHPELPRLKWHRTLQRHFAPTRQEARS